MDEVFGGFPSIDTSVNGSDINALGPLYDCTCRIPSVMIILEFCALFLLIEKIGNKKLIIPGVDNFIYTHTFYIYGP
jgi:hypothetical protein